MSNKGRSVFNGEDVRQMRIVLFSHDTMGLGHMRRNALISRKLVESHPRASILMISGAPEAQLLQMPARVDCLTLPALRKNLDGRYEGRSLDLPVREVVAVRAAVTRAALEAFAPDVLIVDNVPRGAMAELNPTLRYLKDKGTCRCILGLRDVLDDPESVQNEWRRCANEDAILTYYDAVWVYGDPAVFDAVREYGWSQRVARKVRFTGYLDRRPNDSRATLNGTAFGGKAGAGANLDLPPGPLLLVMAGGGEDGAVLMQALIRTELPPGSNCVAVTGPYMPAETKRALATRAAGNPRFSVIEFAQEPTKLIERADRVIAMGGYNTISEVLCYEKPALIVPRIEPRQEQFIRVRRMEELGLLEVLHPSDLTPAALSLWLARSRRKAPNARDVIDFGGLSRLPQLLTDVLTAPPRRDRDGQVGTDAPATPTQSATVPADAEKSLP